MSYRPLATLAFCIALLPTLAYAAGPEPRGRWLTASGNLEVDIAPCEQALCGTVTRVIANRSMSRPGEQMAAADDRPALGMKLLFDFVPSETEVVEPATAPVPVEWRGQIYNRENGKTYRCLMSIDATGNLVLRGYVGLPLFGSTQTWQRVGTGQP